MKPDEGPLSSQSNRRWHRRRVLRSSLVELFSKAVAASLLLQLGTSSKAQLVIQAVEYSEPKFSVSCNQLVTAMNNVNRSCGLKFADISIDTVQLTFSGTSHELCTNSKYEMELELNKILSYLDNICSVEPGANDEPYRLPAQLFHDSYNRHCIPTASLPLTAFTASLNVSCSTLRALPRLAVGDSDSSLTFVGDEEMTFAIPSPTISLTVAATSATSATSASTAATDQATPTFRTDTETIWTTKDDSDSSSTFVGDERTTFAVPLPTISLTVATTSTSMAVTGQATPTFRTDTKPIWTIEDAMGKFRDLFIILIALVGVVVISFPVAIVLTAILRRSLRAIPLNAGENQV